MWCHFSPMGSDVVISRTVAIAVLRGALLWSFAVFSHTLIAPSVQSASAVLRMRSAVVIIMVQSVPDCAVVY